MCLVRFWREEQVELMDWSISKADDFCDLHLEWLRSNDDPTHGNPLLHVDFLAPALKIFGGPNVSILVGREQGRVNVLLPIEKKSPGFWATYAPSQLPITPLLWRSETPIVASLLSATRILDGPLLQFSVLHYDEHFSPPFCGDPKADRVHYCTTMNIDTAAEFDSYWHGRSKKLRDNIKRYQNRAKKDGLHVDVIELKEWSEIRPALRRYGEIESAGWKGQIGTALAEGNVQEEFYSQVLEKFADRHCARVFELTLGGETVASRISIKERENAVFLKTTYKENFSRYSPGRLLLHFAIERLFNDRTMRSIEFYTKVNRDQQQWASHVREIQHINLYRSRTVKKAVNGMRSARKAIGNLRRRSSRN